MNVGRDKKRAGRDGSVAAGRECPGAGAERAVPRGTTCRRQVRTACPESHRGGPAPQRHVGEARHHHFNVKRSFSVTYL
jgi:hypothetical protein